MQKDFNIKEEAGGAGKAIVKNFTTIVTSQTLGIRLYWNGKGTTGIPTTGVYGPLMSAIYVIPNFVPPSEGIFAGTVVGIVVAIVVCLFN
ncbi:hypothetical protein JCGZ_00504 [Jatropha curcas]|uniref:Malectin domain-containing protein n=1 Tax=Jatropha curcas TaxID=180498 RepID=A0A067JU21_JATCU|nr:hypothetical protein JCGZ_00504 [Jatropha curcas]